MIPKEIVPYCMESNDDVIAKIRDMSPIALNLHILDRTIALRNDLRAVDQPELWKDIHRISVMVGHLTSLIRLTTHAGIVAEDLKTLGEHNDKLNKARVLVHNQLSTP